jgi:uncharacterized membrane-anchored protein
MKNKIFVVILTIVSIAQLYIPATIIFKSEAILKKGSKYLFKTAPIDPTDAFRGKYVQLAFEADSLIVEDWRKNNYNRIQYLNIVKDDLGYVKLTGLAEKIPSAGDYIKVKIRYIANSVAYFNYPFDRFYLEEGMAEKAEELYRKDNISGKQDSYAVVRVQSGSALIEDLWIGGKPIKESLKEK